jgi:pSer/pThr/pTyr-binding forkhead associated (FHA) protein
MQLLLEIRSGPNAGTQIPLAPGQPLRIGRSNKAEHAFPNDPRMSGVHCAFECDARGCRVRDLDSSNGTFLNGARIKESTLANGDEIRAGNTVLVFRIVAQESRAPLPSQPKPPSPPPAPLSSHPPASHLLFTDATPAAAPSSALWPAAKPLAPAVPQLRLPDLLRKDFQPLYALLDASREPSVLKVILESKEEHQSLYEGAQGAQLAHFAPYLIRIPPKSGLLDTLIHQAWSKSWGVFLTSDKPLKDLRTHFRHFLTVKLPDGQQVYFRYYDPRVLRLFLPTCLPDESAQFFGPVKQFLIEADAPNLALHFLPGPKGPQKKELHLAPS